MSERVSDERLKVMTREGYRLASGSFVDEEIAAMARELSERRAADRPDDAIVPPGIEDAVIDIREDVPLIIPHTIMGKSVVYIRDTSKPDDAEPITAKWWREVFGSLWYGDIHTSWWLERNNIDSSISLRCECGTKEPTLDLPHIRTRGDLRRLWRALTGKELES